MPTSVVLLVLASALVHALWNSLLKRARDPERAVTGIVVASAITSVAIQLAMRVPIPGWPALGWFGAAGVLEAAYFFTLARALTRAPLGPVYTTVRGGALLVVWPVAILVLGEPFRSNTLAGTLLVLLGLLATGASDGVRAAVSWKGLGWAMVCALFVGGYSLAYKFALAAGASPAFVNSSLVIAAAVNLTTLSSKRRRDAIEALRAEPLRIAVAGALGAAGFLMFLLAMEHAGAGEVLTLRNTSILFAQLFGLLHGDKLKLLGIAGAALVTAGAVLLTI